MKLLFKNVILAFPFIFLLGFNVFADVGQSISLSTQRLISQQNSDGSFGDVSETIPLVTAESVIALQNQPNTESQVASAITFLNNYTPTDNDYLSRILFVTENNTFIQSLLDSQNSDGVWGLLPDFDSDPLDTALAVLALKAINHPDLDTISYALGYLLSTQNTDGGWGFYPSTCSGCDDGDESDVYMTAMVLNTLSQYKTTFNLQSPIDNAVAYLLAMQNPDGGFGSSPSTVYEIALAFEALVGSLPTGSGQGQGSEVVQILQSALNYLTTTQQPNGSWNDDPYIWWSVL